MAMAQDSEAAATAAKSISRFRSAVSRYYYSAYQSATALLIHTGQTPPTGREGWTHQDTPEMFRVCMRSVLKDSINRNKLAGDLKALYKLRIIADYVSREKISADDVTRAGSIAGVWLKCAAKILQS